MRARTTSAKPAPMFDAMWRRPWRTLGTAAPPVVVRRLESLAQQVEQGEQRGSDAVSEATRAKMSAMFMEDEVLPDTTLDDTVSRMEAALAAAKGEAAVEEKVEEKPASSIDDGW